MASALVGKSDCLLAPFVNLAQQFLGKPRLETFAAHCRNLRNFELNVEQASRTEEDAQLAALIHGHSRDSLAGVA
jgi:hypothetical protein